MSDDVKTYVIFAVLFLVMGILCYREDNKSLAGICMAMTLITSIATMSVTIQEIKLSSITPTITIHEGTVSEKLRTGTDNLDNHKIKIETPTETLELEVSSEIYKTINKNDAVKVEMAQKIDANGKILTEELNIKK